MKEATNVVRTFEALLDDVRKVGPKGEAAEELARVVLPQALKGIFPSLSRDHVLATAWLVVMEGLAKESTAAPLTPCLVIERVKHALRSETTQDSTGASALDIRRGHLAAFRATLGLKDGDALLFRVSTNQEWGLPISPAPASAPSTTGLTHVFDELALVLESTGWPPADVSNALGVLEERANIIGRLSLGEVKRSLGWLAKPARDALIDLVFTPDGYVALRLQGVPTVIALARLYRDQVMTRLALLARTAFHHVPNRQEPVDSVSRQILLPCAG